MLFDQMHHVAIIVSGYQKAKEFYVEKLGFPVLRENFRPDKGDWKLDLRLKESNASPSAWTPTASAASPSSTTRTACLWSCTSRSA